MDVADIKEYLAQQGYRGTSDILAEGVSKLDLYLVKLPPTGTAVFEPSR